MGRFILHIGTHKTGTTSIQKGLSLNRALLEKRGIFYPSYDLIGFRDHYAHLGIVNAFSKAHKQMTRADAIRFFEEVARRSVDYDVTIISAEPFFRHVGFGANGEVRKVPGRAEAYWPARMDYIRDVKAHLPVDGVEVVMVVRRQVEYGMSLYQEHVKTSRYSGDFQTFRNQFWHRFDYLRQARAWDAVFHKLHVLRFEDLIGHADILLKFGEALGVPLEGLKPAPLSNVALPPDMVILKRMLHAAAVNEVDMRHRMDRLLTGDLGRKLQALPKRSLYRDFADMQAFHDRYVDANELLKREYMPDTVQDAPMFKPDLNDRLVFGDALDPTFLNQFLLQLEGV
ncbi:hypothetical protein [Celeribacter persicus]|uniref:Sulfotransferase family protein n=1 Tax=Celeribacter persicus TaxID=1651082 RepID=A0A2T5HTT1_9RHOB|nr:hypothetical protein [Celeribacter persicus]PTQ74994.1 hypothetical protein C8N42_103287 [Celeribacter persicus]